jgi:hypothetical protein
MTSPERKNWLERNWKWFVPLLAFCSVIIITSFVAGILYLVLGVVKSSDVYKDAVRIAGNHDEAIRVLGEPIRPRWYVMGNIEVSGPGGHAELSIPVTGYRTGGTLYLSATREAGKWYYKYLILEVNDSGERISLLDDVSQKGKGFY